VRNRIWTLSALSTRLDHRVQQVADGNVVPQNLRPHRSHLGLLLADLLLQLGKLVLEWLNYLVSDFLLLVEVSSALDGLLTPVLVLFGHGVNIVRDVVD